ncbi:IKI3 family-domain-containing protein [Gaertneriomyces semiglobifer]|nr:IKI3 family-domain-containing protein [Gaertneriomyces semiglobifer]
MRNLTLLGEAHAALYSEGALSSSNDAEALIAVDNETSTVYCAVQGDGNSCIFRVTSDQQVSEVTSLPNPATPTEGSVEVITIKYLAEQQALCVALLGGDIIFIHTEECREEIVGSVDSGILAMEWSPDEELVIIVTGTGTLLEMTKDFDVITEVPIHVAEPGKDVHVSVGWGRKETQFHGSAGKQAALQKDETATAANLISADDDFKPRISWRGDGAYFACSAVEPNADRRVIRVYDRECVHSSTSEKVMQLGHSLNWRPSGNLIVSSQRLPHRHDIVFFERNGLRHGEFALRKPEYKVTKAIWSADSSVLALWLQCNDEKSLVQLWTMNNYYWYLKHEVRPAKSDNFATIYWDPEHALRLHIVLRSGLYQRYDFCNDHFISSSLETGNPATVAVIDGCSLLLTPFKHMNIPPPMSSLKLQAPSPISHVAFGPGSTGDDLALLLCDGTIQLYKSHSVTKPLRMPELFASFDMEHVMPEETVRQIAWVNEKTLVVLAYNTSKQTDHVIAIDVSSETATITRNMSLEGNTRIIRLHHSHDTGVTMVEASDGRIAVVNLNESTLSLQLRACFPEVCPWVASTFLRTATGQTENIVIGLSEHNKLYADDRILSSDCTSFMIHNDFIIITTFTHTARFISRAQKLFESYITATDTVSSQYDEQSRRVERGSRIVIAVPAETALVLQMPRGNLETIHPRALVLSSVRTAIDAGQYRDAFMLCRKHRIDMNLLVDHNPEHFRTKIEEFVRQIYDPEYLNLFVSGLRDEDVTATMYTGVGNTPSEGKKAKLEGKTNAVCDTVRQALEQVDATRYTHSILTTDVKKSPPDLESAMRRILTIKNETSLDAAEAALKYVIFLADVDKLYDVALGMYDFTLVLMVAQHSQKDPREYLPFLSELQKLEETYQRYKIDDHLEKREKALSHLRKAGEQHYAECVNYVKRHNLYKAAMRIFSGEEEKCKEMRRLYAEDLEVHSDYEQAALLYEMAGNKKEALACYRKAIMWRETFSLAVELSLPQDEMRALAADMADEMARRLQYREAAQVLLDYSEDPVAAVHMFVKGSFWAEAIRIARDHSHSELVETVVKNGVLTAHGTVIEDVRDIRADYAKRRDRLQRFREEKARQIAEMDNGLDDPSLLNVDMFSDTTSMATTRITGASGFTGSMASRSTVRTARTAKARRKAERKRATGRDKAFEDEYLLKCIRKLVERINEMHGDVLALIRALMVFGFVDQAREVQSTFKGLKEEVQQGMSQVFIPVVETTETTEELKKRVEAGLAAPTHVRHDPPPVLSDAQFGLPILD